MTTELIQDVWAETLGLAVIGPEDDLFALGGHSLKAAAVVAKLGERLGLDVPLQALFEAPTPAEMTELIGELRGEQQRGVADGISPFFPDWVVPLQREGTGRPVFDFPSTDNEPGALAQDAHIAALVGNRPFWAFRKKHPALEPIRERGVPALAAAYVTQMRAIQTTGPYLLYATCGGGYPAWEIARQLLAAGETIAGICFREVPLGADFDGLRSGHTPARISSGWPVSHDYRPPPLPVDLTFLMTDHWRPHGWWKPWRRVTGGTFTPIVMPLGDTRAPGFLEGHLATIAGHIREWIAQSESRAGIADISPSGG